MVKAFPGVNVDYFRVKARRTMYSAEDIILRDISRTRLGAAVWVVSPVNGENLLASATVDSVRGRQELDTIALTHIIVNSFGKVSTQTKIDQFGINGFMNFAQEAGNDPVSWYEDELESWGVAGPAEGEFAYRLQKDIRRAQGTAIGAVEIGKGAVLYLLTQREKLVPGLVGDTYHPIAKWIHACLVYLEAKYRLDFGTPPSYRFFEAILTAMIHDGLLTTSHGVFGSEYRVSRKGRGLMATVYLPIIDDMRIPARIKREMRWLIRHSPRHLYDAGDLFRR